MRETDLYAPIKAHLEEQGYEVKAEIDGCDVVAVRGEEPPVIVELKLVLNLELILQAIDRQKRSDVVYVAVPDDRRKQSKTLLRRSYREVLRLMKLLGLGLIVVQVRAKSTKVDVVIDPAPYQPRKSPKKKRRLLRDFATLRADFNVGGSQGPQVTAYRQDAIACAAYLREEGVKRPAEIRKATGVARAARIVYDNHYGWFERLGRGAYQLSEGGGQALLQYQEVVDALGSSDAPAVT